MAVEVGDGLSSDDHLRISLKRIEQALQCRYLAFKNDLAAKPGYQRHIAGKLDRVAKSLLSVEEDGFPFQGGAVPAGLRKPPILDWVGFSESPLVFSPPL